MKQISARVTSNHRLLSCSGAEYYLMRLQAPEIARECRPGQFLMVKCGDDALLRRPISVHSASGESELELLYAVPTVMDDLCVQAHPARKSEMRAAKGAGVHWLSKLADGCNLGVIGPLGNGFTIESSSNRLLLVAGGIGVAPLRHLADYALAHGKQVTLLLGASTSAAIYPTKMLPSEIDLVLATEDGSLGQKGLITDAVPDYVGAADQVFACGPQAMYQTLSNQMEKWPGGKSVQVSLEVRMGCGTGICYSCGIRTKQGMRRVCKEGPVFNIKDIIWQEVSI